MRNITNIITQVSNDNDISIDNDVVTNVANFVSQTNDLIDNVDIENNSYEEIFTEVAQISVAAGNISEDVETEWAIVVDVPTSEEIEAIVIETIFQPIIEPYCPPIPVYVEPTITAEILKPSTYNTISSRWLLTGNGNDEIDSKNDFKEIVISQQTYKINPFDNLEFWDNNTNDINLDLSTNESWINQPDIIIPPWEIFFAGNNNKVVPTQNTLNYSLDTFNKKTLLFNENSVFLGSNTPPKTMTCWISIKNSSSNYDTVIIGESNSNKWSSTLSLKTGNIDSLMNRLFIEIVNHDATRIITKYSKRAVITNTYHHIALVYYTQEQHEYLDLYTDGYFDFTIDVTDFQLNTNRFTIGGQHSNKYNRYHTQGNILNLTIWNTKMSPENILYLAQINDKTSNGN